MIDEKLREILIANKDRIKNDHAISQIKALLPNEEEIEEIIYSLKNNRGELPPDSRVAKAIHDRIHKGGGMRKVIIELEPAEADEFRRFLDNAYSDNENLIYSVEKVIIQLKQLTHNPTKGNK